ncbi:hypothetical protein BDF22DRAFT_404137 [Syncephalis plumigaleata]|nr:hypothetical protein BDF22DRAFT_404137 [Syncephalis plumigaleata]
MPGDPSLGTYAELGSSASASTASLSSRTSGVGANARNYSRTRNAMVAPLPVDIPSKRRETKPATLVANGSVWGKPVSMTVSDHVVSGGVGSIGVGSSSFDNDTDDNDSCTQSSAIWRPKAARNNAGTPDTSMSNGKPIIATTDNEYPTAAEASKVDTKLNTSTRSKPNNPTTVNKQTISAVTNVHGSFRSHPKDKLVLDEKWDEMSDNGMDFNEDVIEFADGKVRIGGMLSTARASANASPARSDTGGDGMDVRKRRILKSVSFHDNDTRLPSNDIESTKTTKSTGQHTFTTRALDDVGETRNTNAIKNNAYSDKPQVSWRKHDDNNSDNYNHITTTTTSNNNNSNSNYNSDQLFSPTAITPTTESNSIEQSSRGVHYREITANNINVNESEKLCKDTDSISTTKQADSTTNKEATISSISNTTTTATATTTATTTERPKLFQTDRTSSAIERARQRREEEERERVAREKRLAEKLRILEERAKQRDTSVSSEEKEVPESQESKASNNNKDTATSTGSSTRPTSNYNREQSSDSVATGGTHGHAPSRPASYGRRSNHFTMSTATATTSATTHDHTTSSSYRNDTSAIDRVMDAIKQQISSTEEIQERIRASIPGNSTLHLDDTPRSPVSLASVATTWRKATTATSSSTATTTATALTISSATSSSSTTSPIVSIETTMDNAKLASTHSSNIETSATHQQSSSTKTMKSQATPTHRSSPRLPALSSSKPVDANSTLNIDPIQQITLNKSTAQPYRPPALRRALEQQQQQQQQQSHRQKKQMQQVML